MPRYAVIDVGTNSVKFHVGDAAADGRWTTVVDRAEVTRLGEGLAATGGEVSPPAMERTAAAVAAVAAEAKQAGALPISGAGAPGQRPAPHSPALLAREAPRPR